MYFLPFIYTIFHFILNLGSLTLLNHFGTAMFFSHLSHWTHFICDYTLKSKECSIFSQCWQWTKQDLLMVQRGNIPGKLSIKIKHNSPPPIGLFTEPNAWNLLQYPTADFSNTIPSIASAIFQYWLLRADPWGNLAMWALAFALELEIPVAVLAPELYWAKTFQTVFLLGYALLTIDRCALEKHTFRTKAAFQHKG